MTIVIDHQVVLGKQKDKSYICYQCPTPNDIRKDVLPVKLFINGMDFTRKLTSKTRLTVRSLSYIIENISKMSFKHIRAHFDKLYSKRKLAKINIKTRKPKRGLGALGRIEFVPVANRVADTTTDSSSTPSSKQTRPKANPSKPTPKPAIYAKVPLDYVPLEDVMMKASLQKNFDRTFLIYLQVLHQTVQLELKKDFRPYGLYFDHAIFPFLIDHGLKSTDHFTRLVDSILAVTVTPKAEDLIDIFSVMSHQNKLIFNRDVYNQRPPCTVEDLAYEYVKVINKRVETYRSSLPSNSSEDKQLDESLVSAPSSRGRKRKAPAPKRTTKKR